MLIIITYLAAYIASLCMYISPPPIRPPGHVINAQYFSFFFTT